MRQLSKSKLISFRQCPKPFRLDIHRQDLREVPDLHLTDLQSHVRDVPIWGKTWFDEAGAA